MEEEQEDTVPSERQRGGAAQRPQELGPFGGVGGPRRSTAASRPRPGAVAKEWVPVETDDLDSNSTSRLFVEPDDCVGQRVAIAGREAGVLRFVGRVHFVEGTWCGVELDSPFGRHDGLVKGRRYFTCPPGHGILAPVEKVQLVQGAASEADAPRKRRGTYVLHKSVGPLNSLPGYRDENALGPSDSPSPSSSPSASPTASPSSSHPLRQQSSLEMDESLSILTPDQMADFTDYSDSFAAPALPPPPPPPPPLGATALASHAARWMQLQTAMGSKMLDQEPFPEWDAFGWREDSLTEESPAARDGRVQSAAWGSRAAAVACAHAAPNDASPSTSCPSPRADAASERTLSPDELPLDPPTAAVEAEGKGERRPWATTLEEGAGAKDDQQSASEDSHDTTTGAASPCARLQRTPPAGGPVLPPPEPSSFVTSVTSVTSITSLDTGYQGDGEFSRPASRGADHSPVATLAPGAAPAPPLPPPDPMTDSDFFTESDADPHEEAAPLPATAAASGTNAARRGDRRAQVIDGTLYGASSGSASTGAVGPAAAPPHQRCPSFTASVSEEMESSGVFSDLERRSETEAPAETTPTVPAEEPPPPGPADASAPAVATPGSSSDASVTQCAASSEADAAPTPEAATPPTPPTPTLPARASAPPKEPVVRKYKMPKRNVASKVKSMLEAAPSPADAGARAARKPGRWDAVLEKMAVGQTPGHKLRPRLKEVKSKVFGERSTPPASPASPATVQRRCDARRPPPPPPLQNAAKSCSGGSSLSDVSAAAAARLPAASRTTPPLSRASKKQALRDAATGRASSPLSDALAAQGKTRQPRSAAAASTQKSGVQDMKKPARKASARHPAVTAGVTQKATALRDHYRLAPNGVDAASAPHLKQLSAEPTKLVSSRAAAAVASPPPPDGGGGGPAPDALFQRAPTNAVSQLQSQQVTPPDQDVVPASAAPALPPHETLATLLREPLRRCALGFDALAILLQHTLHKVERLEKNDKAAEYDKISREWESSKATIEKYKASIASLEDALSEKTQCYNVMSLKQEELSKENERLVEEKTKFEKETNEIISTLEKKYQSQVKLVHTQYATEQANLQSLFKEREIALKRDLNEKHEERMKEHKALTAILHDDYFRKETLLASEITQLKEDNERVKKQLSIFVEAESKDSRLQASIGRCGELEEEVRSLQSVLELRHQELQELRKSNGSLTRQAEQLPRALQQVTALEARVEDLQAQLKEKCEMERHNAQQQCALVEALQKEVNQKNRLTLLNEELQWKLKQNSEVFSAIATMNGSSTIQLPNTSGASSPALSRRSANGSVRSISETPSSTKGECDVLSRLSVSLMKHINNGHQTLKADPDDDIASPPLPSPKIKGVVEKNDSVSWVLDLEETSGELVSRLLRRAGSFRSTTPSCTQLPPPQTLPSTKRRLKSNSLSLSSSSSAVYRRSASKPEDSVTISCTEHVKNQSDHYHSSRLRSHSISSESVNSENVIYWDMNVPDSFHNISENNGDVSSYDKKHTVKISGNPGYHKIHKQMDMVLSNNLETELKKHSCENGKQNWKCNLTDFSNDDLPTKLSGSSAYTSSDEDVRNNIDDKNRDGSYNSSEKSCHLPNVLPFNTLNICGSPNTADLSLLAACAAAQPALMPKDAAGEAMVSEETSEDENDHEVDEKDETVSSSITRSASENEEEDEEEEEEDDDDDDDVEEEGEDDDPFINI